MPSSRAMHHPGAQAILLSLLLLTIEPAAFADDASQPQSPLTGRAQCSISDVIAAVKQLVLMCKRIDGDTKVLLYECQRQEIVAVGGPNAVGGMVIPAMPNPSGVMTLPGFLPIRKERLDEMTSDIDALVKTVNEQVEIIIFPKGISDEDHGRIQKLQALKTDLVTVGAKLDSVTQGPQYDNLKIAERTIYVRDKAKAIESLCKEIERNLKKGL